MKKSLVLAMAMALGVTASAYAANPFSDVPAGHWAYDSIRKLAAAGIIEGYGDDTFRGDRLMTRYEMAQIVAKALAKGANVDKLAAEFADELDALGVRVAALEKKSDNVKITGAVRYSWTNGKVGDKHNTDSQLRTRLTFTGKVNDNWDYVGLIENRQVFQDSIDMSGYGEDPNHTGEDGKTQFQRAFLKGRLGGAKVMAGRYALELGHSEGDIYSTRFDGIHVSYGSKVRLAGYYGKPSKYDWHGRADKMDNGWKKAWGVNLEADLGKNVTLWAGYDRFDANSESFNDKGKVRHSDDNGIWNAGAEFKMKDVSLAALYAKSNSNEVTKDKGFYVDLNYKGAKADKPGTWGLQAKYYHWGDGVNIAHGWDNFFEPATNGFKGYKLGAKYTVAKGMVAEVAWWDTKDMVDDTKTRVLWTAMNVSF